MNKSIVAYFDILGYQSFLKSNSAVDAAEKVFEIIQQTPHKAVEAWKADQLGSEDRWNQSLAKIQKVVFSDTIVISLPIQEKEHEMDYALMCGIALSVHSSMFELGLPVRGVVTKGQFIFKDTCIAGQAVVDAHTLANQLEFCGVVLSPEFSAIVDDNFKKHREVIWNSMYPYYLCPLKDGKEQQLRIIIWRRKNKNLSHTAAVRESFWKWGKDIPASVDRKIENTSKLLDFCAYHQREIEEKNEPNKAMETTPVAVTDPADAGSAPPTSVSHL